MFRTEIEPINIPFNIDHSSQLVLLGSCFSENIGDRLTQSKFKATINPFGTLFHPLSIFNLLEKEALNEQLIIERDGQFISHELHSSITAIDAEELQLKFKGLKAKLNDQLRTASVLVLTFGTALEYQYKIEGQHIANCHKVPQSHFDRKLSSTEGIAGTFDSLQTHLKALNPNLKTLLTVSPVRHTKDSLSVNNVSKSILRTACHLIQESYDTVYYFPSYEIMMDDLRDYRFYEKDLIHPNEQAIDYIWQKFGETFFIADTQKLNSQIAKLQRAISHKAFNPRSEKHQLFLKNTLSEFENLDQQISFQHEIEMIKSQII